MLQSFLAVMLISVMAIGNVVAQTNYSHTITAKTWSALGVQSLGEADWTAAGTATDGGYFGYDGTKGQQFGSAAKPFSVLTLTTPHVDGVITSVKVNTSGASNVAGTFKVKVGDTYFTSDEEDTVALTSTATEYEFTGSASGAVTLEWAQTSSKALYVKSIVITYTPISLPYTMDFDATPDPALRIRNGNYLNKWVVGQAQGFDNNKLFISSSNGITNKYNISSSSTVTVAREFVIPSVGANLSFDYRVNGEEGHDYLTVDLISGSTTLNIATLQGVGDWERFNYVIAPEYAGVARIVFTWTNDAANGEQYPAALDNISIVPALCTNISNLNIAVDSSTARLSWALVDTTQTSWEVQYKLQDHAEWYSIVAGNITLTLTDLQGSSRYDVRVRALCGENASDWVAGEFATPCKDPRVDNMNAVAGNTPSNLIPFNNGSRNSWNEMIFPAAILGNPGMISQISLECATPGTTMNVSALKIYMANTSRTSHSSTQDWTPQADLVSVYEGTNVQIGEGDVLTIDLTTPFEYEGGNLVLVVSKGGTATNANITYKTDGMDDNVALYRAAASAAYANYPINTNTGAYMVGTLSNLLPNITFTISACNDIITCPDIASIEVGEVTTSTATVTWTPSVDNQTSFLLQYKALDAESWTDVPVQNTTFTITNLNHSTAYLVRVKAICGENDESNYTDEIVFETPNPCPMVTNIAYSNMSTTTSLTWNAGGDETAWEVRFRPANSDQEYVTVNVSSIATTTIGGLPGNTEYEYGIKALCGDNESYWAIGTFVTGCNTKDFDYDENFASVTKPDCWFAEGFAFDGESAVAAEAAWLISPTMNVPADRESYIVIQASGDAFTVKASYRGTAHNRFTTIYTGTASEETQTLIIPIPETYRNMALNFAVVSEGELTVDNVEFTKCPFIPTGLELTKVLVNSVDLQWMANGGTTFAVEYTNDDIHWNTVEMSTTDDTVNYTLAGLEGNTFYSIRVRSICNGSAAKNASEIVMCNTFCAPLQVPYLTDFSYMPECWYVEYTGTNVQTSVTTRNNALVVYNFGTTSPSLADQVGDLYVILPSFDTTLNRLQLSFTAAKYSNSIASKFYLGVITDINDPNTFYQLREIEPTSVNMSEYVFQLNNINENLFHGYLAFRMKAVDATVPQAVVIDDLQVDYIPACAKPANFKMVDGSMTATSIQLTWTQPNNVSNWDIKYGETGFDHETEGTTITANMIPRTVSNLTFGTTYDFYVRAHCNSVNQSEWVGPVTVEMDIPYVLGEDRDITTCMANIYDNGGKTGDYVSETRDYMIIRPVDPATTVTHLHGSYNMESNYDYIYIYDGLDTTADPIQTLTGSGTLDVSSSCGPLTLIMTTDESVTKSGFAFRVSCEAAPSCSDPKNLSFFNNTLSWSNGVYGTPTGYEISYRNTQTTTTHTVTSSTNSYTFAGGLTVGDTYEFKVRSICGVGDTSEWVTKNIVIPCALKTIPYTEGFENVTYAAYNVNGVLPECWDRYTTASYAPHVIGGTGSYRYIHSGTQAMTFYGSGYNYAVMPQFDVPLNQLMIDFWMATESASNGYLLVGYITDNDVNMNTFTTVDSIHASSATTGTSGTVGAGGKMVRVGFNTCPATAARIVFKWYYSSQYSCCVDDIAVNYPPECGAPNIELSASLLTITPGVSLNAPQSYELMIGDRTLNIGNVSSYDLATIPNLASNTEYTVKVRSICSATSSSDWSEEVSYTTPCIAQEVPYFENFDSYYTPSTSTTAPASSSITPYPNHNMPGCWAFPRMSSTTSTYPQYFLTSNSAGVVTGNCLIIRGVANSTDATAAFAVLPPLNANLNDLQITFTYRNGATGATYGELTVGYMTDYNTPSTFVQVGTTTKTTTKTEKTVSFADVNFTGNDYYIAFKYKGGSSAGNYAYIDNVSVNYISCMSEVTNLTSSVTNETTTFTWQGTADAYDLEYGLAGFELGQGTRITGLTSNTYTINNLPGGCDMYVRTNCGNGMAGPWAHTTACAPYSLPYSEDFSAFVTAPTGNSTAGVLPACYDSYFNGTTAGYAPKANRSTSYSPYGVNYNPFLCMTVGLSNTYGNPAVVALPELALPLNRLSVSLTARISSATNGKLELGYVSSSATFTPLTQVTCATASATAPVIRKYNLDQYTDIPSDARIAFRLSYISTTSSSANVGIDDILVEALPFCVTPQITDVFASATTADVHISPSSNAQNYEVVCVNAADPTETHTGTANTTDYTALVSGLTPQTTYKVKARAFCGGTDYSEWSDEMTFTTECLPLSLPYAEGFETTPTCTTYNYNGVVPDCWSSSSTGTIAPHVICGDGTGSYRFIHSGLRALTFYGSGYNYAVMPKFSTPVNQTVLSFWMGTEHASYGTLVVGYIKDNDVDMNTFTAVREIPASSTTKGTSGTIGAGGEFFDINFSNCPADADKIVFRWYYSSQYSCCIDDISVDVLPYCAAPTIESVSTTDATADVHIANNADAQIYEAVCVLKGADVATATMTPVVADNNRVAHITGLDPQTEYDFYARVICDDVTTSEWSRATTAKTMCAPIDVPYSTSFEDDGSLDMVTYGSTYPMLYCWNKVNDNAGTAGTLQYYPGAYSTTSSRTGSRALYFYTYKGGTAYYDLYSVMPEFNVDFVNKLRVKFFARESSTSANYVSHLQVGVMTDPNVASTFVKVADVYPTSTSYEEFTVPLTTYTGNGKFIAIKAPLPTENAPGQTSNYNVTYVDDITVDFIPYCDAPMIDSTKVTDNSITVYMGESNDARAYEAVCVPAGGDVTAVGVVPVLADSNRVVVFTGLNASTLYDVYVRSLCDSVTTGAWSSPASVRTECGPHDLPYTTSFEDDGTLNTASFGSNAVPYCWNKLNTSTTKTYPYSYNSSSYAHTGTRSLYFYSYYSSTATHTSYGDNYAVLPEFNVDSVNKLRVKFFARETSTTDSYISHLEVGVMTNPDSISTFVKVADVYPTTTTYEEFNVLLSSYTGTGKYIAIRAPKPTSDAPNYQYQYNNTYLDDITVDYIPDCFELEAVEILEVTDNTVKVKVKDNFHQGTYRVEYRPEEATEWQGVTVSDTMININGLQSYTSYVLRAQAVCDSAHSSVWTDEVTFLTNCLGGDVVSIGTGTTGSNSYGPYHNYYKNSWNESIYTSEEIGGGGIIRTISRNVVVPAAFTMDTLWIYMGVTAANQIQSTTDWIPMDNLTLVYEGTQVEVGSKAGWETIELQTPFNYNGIDNLVIVTAKKAGNYVSALTYEYSTYSGVYRNLYRNNDSDVSYAEPPTPGTTTGTRSTYRSNVRFMLCPYDNDLAIDSIAPIADACDLSEANITVRVKNKSYVNSATGFVMTYQMGAVEVRDTVTRTLLPQESFLYTFNQIPFVEGSNDITVSVLYNLDENPADNTIALNDIRLVVPQEVPYYQTFATKINFGRDAWVNESANANPIKWVQEDEMMKYFDNDTIDAQAYFITHCINIPAGQYRITYDYNAMSNMPENMNVYLGTTQNLSEMTLIGQHQNFVKSDENQTYEYIFTANEDAVYYIAVEALSDMGNMGITFDNLTIVPIVEVSVTIRPDEAGNANGTVRPEGMNYVVYGDDLSISMIPDDMYHVAGVWVDGVRVMNEDQYNASFMLYTLENITEAHSIEVFFKLEFHINKIAVNANSAYEVGGYFIPAEADTVNDPSAYTVTFAAEPHNHLMSMVVGMYPPVGGYVEGDDVTADVVYNAATNTYSYTLDTLLVANYYLQAMFRKDTVPVVYNVLTGAGIFDGHAAVTDTDTSWVDYGTDHTSTIQPADGYYNMGVWVNGEYEGLLTEYEFTDVVTPQYIEAQFGHKVTTSISNFNNIEYLGSDEVRGTIEPADTMILSGSSCTVTGTVQDHFHLSNMFVNGTDMIANVNMNGNNFTFTIDSLIANTDIQAVVRIDTIAIIYTVEGGNGYVNGNAMSAVSSDTVYIDYGSDFMSQFAAASGYHLVNVTVNGVSYSEIPAWLTEYIREAQYINVTFALNEYDITTAAHGNGTVSEGMHVVYAPDHNYIFTATPAVGYHISQILRNNEALAIANPEATFTDTIAPVLDNYDYVAYFTPNIYTITATAGENGTIDPYGLQSYEYGATPTFTVTANAGYQVDEVQVDDQVVTLTNGAYTFLPLTCNHTISVTFKPLNYTIIATAGNGGSITPEGEVEVASGSAQTFVIAPATGYVIDDVTIDNVSVGAVTSYTFENVNANHTINATFQALNFTITATAGDGGTITGPATVAYGASATYTVTPNAGYAIDYVMVDGEEVALTNSTYTFDTVTANHEIFAAFVATSYTITVTDPDHATITPNGVVTVAYGATPTFTVVPAMGYDVTAIMVNGTNVIANATATVMGAYTYTFPEVTANRTLTANTEIKHFTITKTAGANGTITGPATVDYGSNATYQITPSNGYLIENVTVDGISVGAVSTYTFHNVTADHTIHATFMEEMCVTPTALHVDNVDSTSATLLWYHPGADSYDIQYKVSNSSTWTLVSNVPGFAYNLTNLQSSTYYVFQVKANCSSSNESDWANGFMFRTQAGPSTIGVADYVKEHVNVYAEHNRVHIVNDYAVEINNVTIYDMYGKMIYSGAVISNPEVIELNVAVGTYVVRLNTANGPAVYKVHINR